MQNGKAFPVAVDQSVKIEELNRDSVIGIASSKEASIAYVVPRRVKRHFNEYFRRIGQPRKCAPSVFAAAIVTSLQAGKWSPSIITVDTEYSGHEQLIISYITAHFPRAVVSIERIKRSSPAHAAAYNTHLNHRQPDGILSQHLLSKIIKQQKTAGEPHHPGLTGVRKPNQPVSHQSNKR